LKSYTIKGINEIILNTHLVLNFI